MLDRLFEDGDLGELVALYQALPLLPHPTAHRARAAEGIRSNMKNVFEAVALRQSVPGGGARRRRVEPARPQVSVRGIAALHVSTASTGARTHRWRLRLSDYAHERWAAGRAVSPELWRCLGPFAEGSLLADLERVLATGTERERAAIALSARSNPHAQGLLATHRERVAAALATYSSWQEIAD